MKLSGSPSATLKSPDQEAVTPSVTLIIPAYNARATLPACLAAIAAMDRQADEILLFSDGSTDDTDDIARAAGVTVIRNDGPPRGPAHGRNMAAKAAQSDLLLFVDADVVISPQALDRLMADMLAHGAKAAFGSYDDTPRSRRVTSLYANLRHHHVHQGGKRAAKTFWSGLGLIDRRTFLEAGGFDAALFAHPSIEDIELGARLAAAGHAIRLVPEAQCTHWKDWSLWRVWHTDVVRRALPWSRLIADGHTGGADLNISWVERIKSLVALTTVLFLLAAIVGPWLAPSIGPAIWLGAAATSALLYIALNARFFAFLAGRIGPVRGLAAMAMHLAYHIYAPVTFVTVMLATRLGLRRAPN